MQVLCHDFILGRCLPRCVGRVENWRSDHSSTVSVCPSPIISWPCWTRLFSPSQDRDGHSLCHAVTTSKTSGVVEGRYGALGWVKDAQGCSVLRLKLLQWPSTASLGAKKPGILYWGAPLHVTFKPWAAPEISCHGLHMVACSHVVLQCKRWFVSKVIFER